VEGVVALGELLKVGHGRRGGAGVPGGVCGAGVEQPEHGASGGDRVFPGVQYVRGERGPGGAELVEQASGFIQHRHERLVIGQ
jgi:hypothetical protein